MFFFLGVGGFVEDGGLRGDQTIEDGMRAARRAVWDTAKSMLCTAKTTH